MDQLNGKAEKFTYLAKLRMNRTLKGMDTIGALTNRKYYEYTNEQASQILAALQAKLEDVHARFAGKKSAPQQFDFE